ncbi:MAG: RNA methyltransferase [Lentimicrobiaceae bacterium]|jgi:tRNA G18 (ribose-2'-O)-methylase SpoU|nr:RNA methyltransferase [Lentimicrobiaceae bacterium]
MRKLQTEELQRIDIESYKRVGKMPVVIVLDNIRSLSNVGSVFRSADAFRIEAVFLCGITACPPHREIQKTALGATESVSWSYFSTTQEAINFLKADSYTIFAVEQTDKSTLLNKFVPIEKSAYIFGNEIDGVDDKVLELCDGAIEIPQEGTKHSLNVSVCAGIVMWKLFEKIGVKRYDEK